MSTTIYKYKVKLFYLIKPLIPRSLQLLLRRRLFKMKLNKIKNIWPIFPGSEKKPANWKGWSQNKKFAFVLTHDVEHQRGYERVKDLLRLEKELGFVSSFNFIPERDYRVEKDLLQFIKENGFEAGIHGLNHDGKLFSDRETFQQRAEKINNYIREWGVTGFRAPAVHHNLEWIGELDVQYDLSTFDSDPSQPQPDGVGTIFPFWVNGKNGRPGYVEIPYTLDQDFTLFILMKENSPEIWIKKLAWIVEKGGMALVIVHPDYINFDNVSKLEEFPVKYYEDFLKYVKNNYEGKYWNALPHEIAEYFSDKKSRFLNK